MAKLDPTKYRAVVKIEFPDPKRVDEQGRALTRVVEPGASLPADFPAEAHTGTPGRDDYAEHDALADLAKYGSIEKV